MQQLKEWYEGLDSNEQRIVLVAAVFFSLIIFVFGILKPLSDSVGQLEKQVDSRQKSVDKWKSAMPLLLANSGQSRPGSSSMPLSSVITMSTRKFNLRVSRVQEKGANETQVWFDNIPFNDFIRWVAEVQNTYQSQIFSVNIRSRDRDGLSSIDVKIKKG